MKKFADYLLQYPDLLKVTLYTTLMNCCQSNKSQNGELFWPTHSDNNLQFLQPESDLLHRKCFLQKAEKEQKLFDAIPNSTEIGYSS